MPILLQEDMARPLPPMYRVRQRFDDNRLAVALDILKEFAQNKQVILFTCQSREKKLQGE